MRDLGPRSPISASWRFIGCHGVHVLLSMRSTSSPESSRKFCLGREKSRSVHPSPSVVLPTGCAPRGEKKANRGSENLRVVERDHRHGLCMRLWSSYPREFTRARYSVALLPPPDNAAAERFCTPLCSSSIARARASFRKRSGGAKGNMRCADPMRRGASAECERVWSAGLSAKRPSGRVRCKKIAFYS